MDNSNSIQTYVKNARIGMIFEKYILFFLYYSAYKPCRILWSMYIIKLKFVDRVLFST